jgi:hypothetical protein
LFSHALERNPSPAKLATSSDCGTCVESLRISNLTHRKDAFVRRSSKLQSIEI